MHCLLPFVVNQREKFSVKLLFHTVAGKTKRGPGGNILLVLKV